MLCLLAFDLEWYGKNGILGFVCRFNKIPEHGRFVKIAHTIRPLEHRRNIAVVKIPTVEIVIVYVMIIIRIWLFFGRIVLIAIHPNMI